MSDDGEMTTIDNLIKNLQNEICVNIEVEENEASDSKTPVKISFIVENTRDSSRLPNIVFEDVKLVFGIPPDMKTINIPRLAPAESHVYDYCCRYSELPLIQYAIKGNISPESLFQFETGPNVISPDKKGGISIKSYKKMIAELDIYKWLEIIPKVTMIPKPETTLSQLKEQENRLSSLIAEVRNTGQQIHDFSRFQDMSLQNQKRESIIKHRNMIIEYLKEVERGIAELRGLYSSQPKMNIVENTRNKIVSKLSTLLQNIDEATEQLFD